jgi:hypothetical protein
MRIDVVAQDAFACVKPQRTGFDSRPVQVDFVVVKVTGKVFIRLLAYSLGSIIAPMLHDNLLIYHRRYILATDSVVKHTYKNKTREHKTWFLHSVMCRVIQFAEQILCVTQGQVQTHIKGCKWGKGDKCPSNIFAT